MGGALSARAAFEAEKRALAADLPGPGGGITLVERMSALVDRHVLAIVDGAGEGAPRVLAVGGYGRSELSAASDVDLLFLVPAGGPPPSPFVERVLYRLWDLGLEVGHATRTLDECLEAARADPSVLTALLEVRPIAPSDAAAASELVAALRAACLRPEQVEPYVGAKLAEAERRRQRYRWAQLEPDLKSGRGGLRDLHTAEWIAFARTSARGPKALVAKGLIEPAEARALERARDLLLRVRFELHLLAGRRRDGLGFEHQEQIAERLGFFPDGPPGARRVRRGTERLMRALTFHGEALRRIAERIVDRSAPRPPARLHLPLAELLWRVRVRAEDGQGLSGAERDALAAAALALTPAERRSAPVVRELLKLLSASTEALTHLHDAGLLRALVPELRRITARWQHSLVHVYPVDAHSIETVLNLARLGSGELLGGDPRIAELGAELPRPAVLRLAGLLHDVGKGSPGLDHSTVGARLARAVGARLEAAGLEEWGAEETADLSWLVADHLLLSETAQRRDLSDPAQIAEFAARCRTPERLTMLLLLTLADLRATGPRVFTELKGKLIRDLFEAARLQLAGPDPSGGAHEEARRRRAIREILDELGGYAAHDAAETRAVADFVFTAPARYLGATTGRAMARHLELLRRIPPDEFAVELRPDPARGGVELSVVGPDRPGALAEVAGALAARSIEIASAQVFTLDRPAGGTAMVDLFALRGLDRPERWPELADEVTAVLDGRSSAAELLLRRPAPRLKRPTPAIEVKVKVSNRVSPAETVLDVFGPDRVGALYAIARALAAAGLAIHLAKISTEGERLADAFYVTDAATGAKIEDPARLRAIAEAVSRALS